MKPEEWKVEHERLAAALVEADNRIEDLTKDRAAFSAFYEAIRPLADAMGRAGRSVGWTDSAEHGGDSVRCY